MKGGIFLWQKRKQQAPLSLYLENNTFDVSEQLPFKVPSKTKVIEEMAPPKSNGRKLPITELARPFFLKQFAMQEAQREQAEKDGKPYYDNDLVVAKPDGSPISASWVCLKLYCLLPARPHPSCPQTHCA